MNFSSLSLKVDLYITCCIPCPKLIFLNSEMTRVEGWPCLLSLILHLFFLNDCLYRLSPNTETAKPPNISNSVFSFELCTIVISSLWSLDSWRLVAYHPSTRRCKLIRGRSQSSHWEESGQSLTSSSHGQWYNRGHAWELLIPSISLPCSDAEGTLWMLEADRCWQWISGL